jgi:tryptophanyl-tRNA synthetase
MTPHSDTTNHRPATLTGIKPTGELHLGNYAGAIRPLARLAAGEDRDVFVFAADLHALSSQPDAPQPGLMLPNGRRRSPHL